MGLWRMGPSGTLWGRGQRCALLVAGVSLPFLNQFWLLWSSAAYHLGKSYIFHSAGVFLARFPYTERCCLPRSARHGGGCWAKPLCACPALLWVKPCGLANRGAGLSSGTMEELKGICVKKHPYFAYSSSRTRASLVFSVI